MNRIRLVAIIGAMCVAATAGVIIPIAHASSCHSDHEQKPKMDMGKAVKAETLSLEKIHSEHLPMVSQLIEKSIKAIEAGDKEAALEELHKVQRMLIAINTGIAKNVQSKFANSKCPIMGGTIDPAKVPDSLIRDFKDQKVAFCCGGCPDSWDKLSDVEKEAKLAKVKVKTECQSHKHGH